MSNSNYILNKLPKDVVRIINKYLYNYIYKEVKLSVAKASHINFLKDVDIGGGLLMIGTINKNKITLISKKCKMCKGSYKDYKIYDPFERFKNIEDIDSINESKELPRRRNLKKPSRKKNDDIMLWYRKAGGVNVLNGCYDMSICKKLVLSQDLSTLWTQAFNQKCRYSIIDGVVYHCVESENKYRLVPIFKSDHCWQDIGLMFSRCQYAMKKDGEKPSQYAIEKDIDYQNSQKNNGCTIF